MDFRSNTTGFDKKPKLTPDREKQPVIIQTLDVRPVNRKSADIALWRRAIRQAESRGGSRVALYDLYHEILLDGHLQSVVEKRLLAVANADWEFVDADGEPIDEVNEWIDTHHFEELVREIANTRMWGYTMLELDFYKDGGPGVFLIPRKHMRPEYGGICAEQTGWNIESIRQGKYARRVLEVGKEEDLGLLMAVAQYVIYKRGDIGDWAQFIEVFGQPLVDAVWDGFDENQRLLLLDALDKMGGGGQIVRPEGTDLNFVSGTTANPTGELFEKLYKACNAEISKTVIGQTETTESSQSSGYAQAKEHGETEDQINKADRNYVRRVLNGRLRKLLELNGWNLHDGKFRISDEGEDRIKKTEKFNIDMQMKKGGIPISDDHFYENYGVDKPEDYDRLKADMERQREANANTGNAEPKPGKKNPKMKALSFPQKRGLVALLRDFF